MKSSDTVVLFTINRLSSEDGPGLRTVLCFKGCSLNCRWCGNPGFQNVSPEIIFHPENCRRNFDCLEVCDYGAISTVVNQRINTTRCSLCKKCVRTCSNRALEFCGWTWDVDTLLGEVLKDQEELLQSNGGVTLTGGEPMMQHCFLKEFLPHLKNEGLHVIIETHGLFEWEALKEILPYIDEVYFNVWCLDDEIHKQFTGHSNRTILKNIELLSREGVSFEIHLPLVQNYNDDHKNISEVSKYAKVCGIKSPVHLKSFKSNSVNSL